MLPVSASGCRPKSLGHGVGVALLQSSPSCDSNQDQEALKEGPHRPHGDRKRPQPTHLLWTTEGKKTKLATSRRYPGESAPLLKSGRNVLNF